VRSLEEQLKEASGQERTILQQRIRQAGEQIKTEEGALGRCREGGPAAPPISITPPPDPRQKCERIVSAIDRLRERVLNLEQEVNEATGPERTVLRQRIKRLNQQIKTEETALVRCRDG